jgi:hypothetical protein
MTKLMAVWLHGGQLASTAGFEAAPQRRMVAVEI